MRLTKRGKALGLIAGYPTVTTPALRAAITGPTPTERKYR